MIGPGWMPSRPRPIGRGKLLFCHVGGPRRRHARRPCRAAPVGPGSPALDHGDGCGGVSTALPTATLRATTAAWHRVAAGDLQRWLGERWSWLRPRTVPIIVAFAAMLAMIEAVKRLTIYTRGDDVIQLPAAHYCAAYRDASSREHVHVRLLLMTGSKGSIAEWGPSDSLARGNPRDVPSISVSSPRD